MYIYSAIWNIHRILINTVQTIGHLKMYKINADKFYKQVNNNSNKQMHRGISFHFTYIKNIYILIQIEIY